MTTKVAAMSQPDEPGIVVSPWTVLMAIRYGLGRATYAHQDAINLLQQHWPALRRHSDSIIADLDFVIRTSQYPDVLQSTIEVRNWILAQERES